MSAMQCRECDLAPYVIQPDGPMECADCGHRLDPQNFYLDPDETWSVDETGTVHVFLTPAACLKWLDDIATLPTGDWAKAQNALWQYRRATAELVDALRAGLPLPA
ncbi:hypothetical protein ABZ705_27235 [Streptomyces sp. NPDC006984]|uniref:hypothetical protein n=1 Tax=Streptomyces sp. NPDC006984 TaxID=3155463 RepID=UPI0033C30D77